MSAQRTAPAVGYLAAIVAANWLTDRYGLVTLPAGLTVTAGTFAAGLVLVARNFTQDSLGRSRAIALMATGAVLSWWLASPELAVASLAAFAVSETTDMAVYSPLRRYGWARASLAACCVGAVIDTALFLHLAGFPVWSAMPGQLLVKVGMCALAVMFMGGARAVLREPVHAEGA